MSVGHWAQRLLEKLVDEDYLLNSGGKRQKSNTLFLSALIAAASVVAMGIRALQGGTLDLFTYLFPLGTSIASLLCILLLDRAQWSAYLLSSAMLIYSDYLLLRSPAENFPLIWLLLFPVCACFFWGNGFAIPYLALTLVNILAMFSPLFDAWRLSDYPPELRLGLPMMFVVFTVVSVGVEYIREKTSNSLIQLAHSLTESAHKDQLTKLYNRRAFYDIIGREITRARLNGGTPIQLIMCDIDHFKVINDRYEHQGGDRFLVHIAEILTRHLRDNDYCFRWGGEEFLLLLTGISPDATWQVAQRLRQTIEQKPLEDPQCGTIAATMSFGLHQLDPSLPVDENIARSDRMLYLAKQNGRNRVECSWDH